MAERETDALTGTETTGHEWDGIKELNPPLPKWWLYTFYATIVWAFGYFVLYPAWPTFSTFTKGTLGYSSRADIAETMPISTCLSRSSCRSLKIVLKCFVILSMPFIDP